MGGGDGELWKVLEQRSGWSRGCLEGKAACLSGAQGFVGEFLKRKPHLPTGLGTVVHPHSRGSGGRGQALEAWGEEIWLLVLTRLWSHVSSLGLTFPPAEEPPQAPALFLEWPPGCCAAGQMGRLASRQRRDCPLSPTCQWPAGPRLLCPAAGSEGGFFVDSWLLVPLGLACGHSPLTRELLAAGRGRRPE